MSIVLPYSYPSCGYSGRISRQNLWVPAPLDGFKPKRALIPLTPAAPISLPKPYKSAFVSMLCNGMDEEMVVQSVADVPLGRVSLNMEDSNVRDFG